ncbi:hypothetical protein HZS_5763 [Henneguya salminicola]|nr:hypothetical protein HZS_5763 [Henneguya salminicola]
MIESLLNNYRSIITFNNNKYCYQKLVHLNPCERFMALRQLLYDSALVIFILVPLTFLHTINR